MVEIGLGEVELMSNHCEALAGAPAAAVLAAERRVARAPEQAAERRGAEPAVRAAAGRDAAAAGRR